MLAIRMQRTGRKGHAMFRVVVQESRLTPTSGKVVARLGSYDPHGKSLSVDKEKASFYLEHGAQPSARVARLLKADGVSLPAWVKEQSKNESKVRTPEKRRSTNPVKPEPAANEEVAAESAAPAVEEPSEAEATTGEAPAETPVETSEEQPPEQPTEKEPEVPGPKTEEDSETTAEVPNNNEADAEEPKKA